MSCQLNSERDVLFSFGLIIDIQYADINNKQNYSKTKWRRYRNSLVCLQEAIAQWKDAKCSLAFTGQLGDVTDGYNSHLVDVSDNKRNFSKEALDTVLN